MTYDSLYQATRLSKHIEDLDIFILNLESTPTPDVPPGIGVRLQYDPLVARLAIYPKDTERFSQPDEYVALCHEFGPLILARLKKIRAKWQTEFESL